MMTLITCETNLEWFRDKKGETSFTLSIGIFF